MVFTAVVGDGFPVEAITRDLLRNVFGNEATILTAPATDVPLGLPESALSEIPDLDAIPECDAYEAQNQPAPSREIAHQNGHRRQWLTSPFRRRGSAGTYFRPLSNYASRSRVRPAGELTC
jgi:hypothetical protein